MGTVSHMSPEQSVGKGVDQRSDIWSVGVVLYEMIAGQVPFQGKDIHRQIIAIQEGEPLPLSQQVEGVPDRLEEINSAHRYQIPSVHLMTEYSSTPPGAGARVEHVPGPNNWVK